MRTNLKTIFCPQITQINADFKAIAAICNMAQKVSGVYCLIGENLRNLRITVFSKILIFVLLSSAAQAAPFATGNFEAGKKLFEQSHCNRCHAQMMGGDGSGIFIRPDRKVRSASQLIAQINVCGGNAGLNLSAQDEQNLGAYLNQSYYKLP